MASWLSLPLPVLPPVPARSWCPGPAACPTLATRRSRSPLPSTSGHRRRPRIPPWRTSPSRPPDRVAAALGRARGHRRGVSRRGHRRGGNGRTAGNASPGRPRGRLRRGGRGLEDVGIYQIRWTTPQDITARIAQLRLRPLGCRGRPRIAAQRSHRLGRHPQPPPKCPSRRNGPGS